MQLRDQIAAINERIKLLATTVNTIGLTLVALGILRPAIDPDLSIGVIGAAYGVLGVASHIAAHYILREMRKSQ